MKYLNISRRLAIMCRALNCALHVLHHTKNVTAKLLLWQLRLKTLKSIIVASGQGNMVMVF